MVFLNEHQQDARIDFAKAYANTVPQQIVPWLQLLIMSQASELGTRGEAMAKAHLQGLGYRILECNWRYGRDEIDLVAMDGEELVIVEVKTRTTNFFGDPAGFLKQGQQKRIIRTADAYIKEKNLDVETRFDVVGIVLNAREQELRHIKRVFIPGP